MSSVAEKPSQLPDAKLDELLKIAEAAKISGYRFDDRTVTALVSELKEARSLLETGREYAEEMRRNNNRGWEEANRMRTGLERLIKDVRDVWNVRLLQKALEAAEARLAPQGAMAKPEAK